MGVSRAVLLGLMGLGCWLLALVLWQGWPGNVWAVIGLVLVPVCMAGLLGIVVYEWRVGAWSRM